MWTTVKGNSIAGVSGDGVFVSVGETGVSIGATSVSVGETGVYVSGILVMVTLGISAGSSAVATCPVQLAVVLNTIRIRIQYNMGHTDLLSIAPS